MTRKESLVSGWGINDCPEKTRWKESGKVVVCPHYSRWATMLRRCLIKNSGNLNMEYYWGECSVGDSFKYFSQYREWEKYQGVSEQNSKLLSLDKDILFPENTEYSKEYCCIVPKYINTLLLLSDKSRGDLPIGVTRIENTYKGTVSVCGKVKYLGRNKDPQILHGIWQEEKVKAMQFSIDKYKTDSELYSFLFREDVVSALTIRINKIKNDIKNSCITTGW